MKNYYELQLDKIDLSSEYYATIKIVDYKGNSTNCLSLTDSAIDALIDFFKRGKERKF